MTARFSKTLLPVLILLSACVTGPGPAEPPTSSVSEPPPVADGEHFGFVTVGTDEADNIVVGFDEALLLHGEEARQAAIDAGVIDEGEDLPNDFFIVNEEEAFELLTPDDDARFTLLSGDNPEEKVMVNLSVLKSVYDGEDIGQPIYGIAPGTPFAMTILVERGLVTQGDAVYLP